MSKLPRFAHCAAVALVVLTLALSAGLRTAQADNAPKYQQIAVHPATFGEVGITPAEVDALFGQELRDAGFTIVENEKAARTLVLRISFYVDDDDDDNDGIPDNLDKDDDGDGVPDSKENAEVIDLDEELDLEDELSAEERRKPHQKLLINIHCTEFNISATSDYLDVIDDFVAEEDDDDGPNFAHAPIFRQKPPPFKAAARALSQVQPGGTKTMGDQLATKVARKT